MIVNEVRNLMATEGELFTHRGRRARNEDTGCIVTLPNGGRAAIVCDGMGGHLAGDYASEMTANALANALMEGLDPPKAIEAINAHLHQQARSESSMAGMGTTVVCVVVVDGTCTFFNVGDSRGYLKKANRGLVQVTLDHSYVEDAVRAGEMSREQATSSSYRNALTRAIGTDPVVAVDIFGPFPWDDGDLALLCTDGVYKVLDHATMEDRVSSDPGLGPTEAALEASRRNTDDNVTVAVLWTPERGRAATTPKVRERAARKTSRVLDKLALEEDRRRSIKTGTGQTLNRRRRRVIGATVALAGCLLALLPIVTPRLSRKGPAIDAKGDFRAVPPSRPDSSQVPQTGIRWVTVPAENSPPRRRGERLPNLNGTRGEIPGSTRDHPNGKDSSTMGAPSESRREASRIPSADSGSPVRSKASPVKPSMISQPKPSLPSASGKPPIQKRSSHD